MYPTQTYTRAPVAATHAPAPVRRHPLANAASHLVNHANAHQATAYPPVPLKHEAEPPKPPSKTKVPSSPPLPRQNSKTTPPSPPKIITDKTGRLQFSRVGFLGEGGFARVYEVKDPRGHRLACKVVTKTSLKTKKAKTKLYAEIKIHRSLDHPNIVSFQDCFEDHDNVYMTLELCPCGSLMDMLRRRRRFTEPEARFFMLQLIGACVYMHTHQVIHRDLKLGNIFLDGNMNVKVGDFGLAALIENPGERKKTICGTPNYIAPEVLFDTANGHSFEVDTWSVGVILYTLVVGRPPFQTKDVKAIYTRIQKNEYEFPADRPVSQPARDLITHILTTDPAQRPTLHEIAENIFFTQGPVPAYIPTSAHDSPPDFRHVSKAVSDGNLRRIRRYAGLDDPLGGGNAPAQAQGGGNSAAGAGLGPSKSHTTSIAQQEKEFQKAVQPGSPISALLSSARQPLVMSNPGGGGAVRESPLLRKLQAVKESPLGRRNVTRGLDGIVEEHGPTGRRRDEEHHPHEEEEMRLRKKELESQKARIVAQMAPVREGDEDEEDVSMLEDQEEEEMRRVQVEKERERERVRAQARKPVVVPPVVGSVRTRVARDRENVPPPSAPVVAPSYSKREHAKMKEPERQTSAVPFDPLPSSAAPAPKLNGFDAVARTLTLAFDAKAQSRVFRDPRGANLPIPDEKVFIVSWVDYCNKYGMGYALTDGSVGVHFNDSSSLVLSPDKVHFDYIAAHRQGTIYLRKSHTTTTFPPELKSKVYLLKHFERYIMDRLYGEYEYTFEDREREKGMVWVQKYLRMKHVIVFRLSHDVLQFNFYDHSKLILSSQGLLITHIDKHYKMTRWTLADVMALSLQHPQTGSSGNPSDPDAVKFNQRLVDKLKYCKEVLTSIRSASGGEEGPEVGAAADQALVGGLEGAGSSRAPLR